MQFKNCILLLFILLLPLYCFSQKYSVSGGIGEPYPYGQDLVGTGIDKVYLFNTLSGAKITFSSSSPSIKFYRYQQSLANKQPVPSADINESSAGGETTYTVSNLLDGWGYYADDNKYKVVWIIDYTAHRSVINSIEVLEDEDKCENLKLIITKDEDLHFYLPGGQRRDIKTTYNLSYNTMKWEQDQFVAHVISEEVENLGTEYNIVPPLVPPLVDTRFILEGDQFATHFNLPNRKVESALYEAITTEAHILSRKEENTSSNIPESENADLNGAAPLEINFYGRGNDPVSYFYTWNIYNLKNPESPVFRSMEKEISYLFEQSGDYKVVLEVANKDSYCSDTTSVNFTISESSLDVPNFFSPGDSPGSNDEFRVAYKSLIRFKCTIFNRWGVKLYEFSDPSKGWDGRYRGSYVKPGVYFYVIDAEGSDGIKYKKAGDINILRSR